MAVGRGEWRRRGGVGVSGSQTGPGTGADLRGWCRFSPESTAVCVRECVCAGVGVCRGRAWGVSQRVRHVRFRERRRAGCVPRGVPGLALWRCGRDGLGERGCAGIWPPLGWLELEVASFSPPPTLPRSPFVPCLWGGPLLPSRGGTAGIARTFLGDPPWPLIQPWGGDPGGACGMWLALGKHAVTPASVKLVAEVGI